MFNELILGVLLIVTLVLIVMLFRFFQVIGKNPPPPIPEESAPVTEPETGETDETED